MIRLILIFSFLCTVLLGYSCSTAPEFERDNFFDPESKTPILKFVDSAIKKDRGSFEANSFKLIANYYAIESQAQFNLVSNKDGIFYSSSVGSDSVVFVNETELSIGVHLIKVIVENEVRDSVSVNVNLPDNLSFRKVEWEAGTYNVSWSKYKGEGFQRYELYSKGANSNEQLVWTFNVITDTVFIDYNFPFDSGFNYLVRIYSSEFDNFNETISDTIYPVLLRTWDPSFIKTPNASENIFYRREHGEFYQYNIFSNEITSFNVLGDTYTLDYFINYQSSPNKIIISQENTIETSDLDDFQNSVSYPIGPIKEVSYDPEYNIYFAARINYTNFSLARFKFEPFSDTLINFEDCDFIAPRINTITKEIYAIDSNGSCTFTYENNFSEITKTDKFNTYRYQTDGIYRNQVSPNGQYYLTGDQFFKPTLFETSLFKPLFSLNDSESYFIDFHFDSENESILYASNNTNKLHVYNINEERLVFEYIYNEKISHIFEKQGQIYLLFRKGDERFETDFMVRRFEFDSFYE